MNAAYLLLTAGLWTGQAGHCPPPAPVCPSNHCGPSFCERLREKLCGLFQRDCCDPCAAPQVVACPAPRCEPRCQPACRERCRLKLVRECVSDTSCHGPSLLERLRGLFHRDCCDDACHGVVVTPKSGEHLSTPPKKMPTSLTPPRTQEIRIDTPPTLAPISPAVQRPAAPAITPGVFGDNLRNPF
ncbi:MAG: hypothetical protein L0215_05210 [Gemmataceae bacterium]|nr:hypothetical protein [Gemmataceae bacterium]